MGPPNSQCVASDADDAELLADFFDDRTLDFDLPFDGFVVLLFSNSIFDACCKVTSPCSTSFLRSDGSLSFCVLIRELRLFAGLLEDLRGIVRYSQVIVRIPQYFCVSIRLFLLGGVRLVDGCAARAVSSAAT